MGLFRSAQYVGASVASSVIAYGRRVQDAGLHELAVIFAVLSVPLLAGRLTELMSAGQGPERRPEEPGEQAAKSEREDEGWQLAMWMLIGVSVATGWLPVDGDARRQKYAKLSNAGGACCGPAKVLDSVPPLCTTREGDREA